MDFQRDVRNGDLIELLYEANFTKSNVIIGNPLVTLWISSFKRS